jgi:hypothetical protein
MRAVRIAVLILAAALTAAAAEPQTNVTVTQLPPEEIPAGTCISSTGSYLVTGKGEKPSDYKLSDKQIGEYIRVRLSQGYSVTLYPQASGKIYTVETCHPRKP